MRQRIIATALGVLAGVVASVGALAVVGAAFTLSFDALRDIATAAHVRPSLAWLYPVAVDGAMAVAAVTAVVLRRMRQAVWYPWTVVVAGAAISTGANALHAYVAGGAIALPAKWAMAVSAVPPLLLALSVHLLIVLAEAVRYTTQPTGTAPAELPDRQHAPASAEDSAREGADQDRGARNPVAEHAGPVPPVLIPADGQARTDLADRSAAGPVHPGVDQRPPSRPARTRTGPHQTGWRRRPASADRTGHANSRADRTDLEAAARTVHARLIEAGTPLNRQTLTEALRRDGHSLSNAAAGQLLAVLRADRSRNGARPSPSAEGVDHAPSG